jgi:4-amino-4-deoxy-L-arabinose transferase-like glycosyltransferase
MSESVRYQLWLVAAAGVIFFTNLGATALFDMDEALYATCAREMLDRDNLVVPWFNGEMFPEKPPLMFWTMMAGFELFGVNELGARFFSAVLAVGTVLVTFHLGRLLFSLRVAFWAGLITASTLVFTISARAATVDSALTFFTALAFLMFVIGWKGSGVRGQGPGTGDPQSPNLQISESPNPNPQSLIPNPFPLRYAVAAYACIGVAVLGKGPVGMLLPLAAMGLFLLMTNGWRKLFSCAWWMRPVTAVMVVAVVALPWYVAVGVETKGEWLKEFFVNFNLRPFKQPIQGHGDVSSLARFSAVLVSILYYFFQIPAILVGFFPWSVFLGPTALDIVRRLKSKGVGSLYVAGREQPCAARGEVKTPDPFTRNGIVLALCWFGVWFVFWSICKTKLFHYLLPAYPALALLTACFIDRWLATEIRIKGSGVVMSVDRSGLAQEEDKRLPTPLPAWALRNAWISTILVGVGIMIAIPLVAAKYLPGEERLGLFGLIPVLGGAWCWWKTSRGLHEQAAITFAIMSVAFLTAVFGFGALRVDPFQNAKSMMTAVCADEVKTEEETAPDQPSVGANRNGPAGAAHIGGLSPFPQSPLATYCFFRESTVFYGGKPVTRCDDNQAAGRGAQQALAQFFAKNPGRCYVITTDEHAAELEQAKVFRGQLKTIHRERRFLADGEMVVLRHGQ